MNRWWISELSIQEDHVHLIIQTKPSDNVAEVIQRLKGGASRVIRKEFPELEEFLWGDSFWADGYFAETVGNVDEEVVRRYIREQRRYTVPDHARRPETLGFSPGSGSLTKIIELEWAKAFEKGLIKESLSRH
jgi:hypothetical protein